jgi:hypothetical protein
MFGNVIDDDEDEIIDVDGLNEIDSKFQVPDGWWEARTISAVKELSKTSGKPMVTLTVALTGDVYNDDGVLVTHEESEKHGGKEFKTWISLTPAALFKVKQAAESLDLPITEEGRLRCKLSAFLNKRLMVQMKTETYQDRESSKVGNLARHPDGPELDD